MQIPLTYRGAPLEGGNAWLIGTMQHSVLGRRWVYDATGDPAYLAAVATAAVTRGGQAEQYIAIDGELVRREPTAVISGSGKHGTPVPSLPSVGAMCTRHEHGATVVEAGNIRLVILRVPSRGDATRSGSRGLAQTEFERDCCPFGQLWPPYQQQLSEGATLARDALANREPCTTPPSGDLIKEYIGE